MRVAINGFGRIGRLVLRVAQEKKHLNIVRINDPTLFDVSAHLYQYDSIHGRATLQTSKNFFDVGFGPIAYTCERNVTQWNDIDLVLECSGFFTKTPYVHLEAGAKKVLVSAPCESADKTVVYGVNHGDITIKDKVISNASCTTNCLAPIAYLLNNTIGIAHGHMTTIHSYTADQNLVDSAHNDLRRARAAALSMIPSSTGAAKAIGLVIPSLRGKLDGAAIRVPTSNVSAVDFTFRPLRKTSKEEINHILKSDSLDGVLMCVNEPLVSVDFNHTSNSSIVDLCETHVIEGGEFCRVLTWYDNEWAFANRMCDVAWYIQNLN
jgi:glyceraldehyde 3-phosphate dehydrogenase